MKNFFIKEGYKCNLDCQGQAIPYLDDERSSSAYQVKVYEFAQRIFCRYKAKSILDIGCGCGIKLKEIILPVCNNIVGIDTKHSIDFCKREHSFGRWFEDDVERSRLTLNEKFDLIISSDVVEHLANPDNLLKYVKKYSNPDTHIIISTPERDLTRGESDFGPPVNRFHIREWNMVEFQKYINSTGFMILGHFLVGESRQSLFQIIRKLILLEPLKKIQIIHCKLAS